MLDAKEILDQAAAANPIADVDRPAIQRHLEALVASVNADGDLSPQGEAITRAQFAARAADRLEGLRWVRDYPEIAEEKIEAPVVMTSLPRSGTTTLEYLFDLDPRFRLIRTWEASAPHPPPGIDPASVEERKAAEASRRGAFPLPEGFGAIHLMDLNGPEECHAVLEQAYAAAGYHNFLNVPGYFDFLCDETDFDAVFRVHKRQLQLWQWKGPRMRWALKYPNHSVSLDAIVRAYPDVRFVMTHRDPVQIVASIAKLTLMLRSPRVAHPSDPKEVGRQMVHFIDRHIEKIMKFVDGPEAHRAVHADYYRLLDRPAEMMAGIQAELGIDTPASVTQAISDWHRANPKNKRGANAYALEQFGINSDEVAERFSAYRRRFDIPREHEALAALET